MGDTRARAGRFGAEMIDDGIAPVDLTGDIKERGGMLSPVVLRVAPTGKTRDLDATGPFIAIGHAPRTELSTGRLDLDTFKGRVEQSG